MKIIVGMATFEGREKSCELALQSLQNQVDNILLYDNSLDENVDLKDNGKFVGLQYMNEDVYFLTCDDDLFYSPGYAEQMCEAIDRTGGIVTHHGRLLEGLGRNYFKGHKNFRCLDHVGKEERIDVAGTGVSGFKTSVFRPEHLATHELKGMADLIFSLEAVKQGIDIFVQPHEKGFIKQLQIDFTKSLYEVEHKDPRRQNEIADKIYSLRYGKAED